jgi:hypothetical protein
MLELLIANHVDQSLCLANKKRVAVGRSYLLHSSLAGAQLFVAPFTSLRKLSTDAGAQSLNSSSKPACFNFSSSDFRLQGHILSISGDALSYSQF